MPSSLNSKLFLYSFLSFVLLSPSWRLAECNPTKVEVGQGVQITIPEIEGFSSISPDSKIYRIVGDIFTPPSARLLALFLTNADAKSLEAGLEPAFDRYIAIHIPRTLESVQASPNDFSQVANTLKKQNVDVLSKAEPNVQKIINNESKEISNRAKGTDFTLKISGPVPLGVLNEGAHFISTGQIRNVSSTIRGNTEDVPMITVGTLALIKKRLISIATTSVYKSISDVQWANTTSQQTATLLLDIN